MNKPIAVLKQRTITGTKETILYDKEIHVKGRHETRRYQYIVQFDKVSLETSKASEDKYGLSLMAAGALLFFAFCFLGKEFARTQTEIVIVCTILCAAVGLSNRQTSGEN